ncbi:MAG: hypothetical protein JO011_11950, partial [Ktedonobacteraceae bacterium]|nr:hypothetical protein [Ktedonobacteraceae bacterium]
MYNTSANDLERVASDLDRIAQKYKAGSEELDQHVITLEGATSHLLSGGVQQWRGISSEAFLNAWLERKARLQQASTLMSESAGYLAQLSRTIEDNLPTIRSDQNVMGQQIFHKLGIDDQASVMNEESQAQNAVFMAIAALNSQLEQLIEEVNDCPEADQEGPFPGYGDNISRNDSGATPEGGTSGDSGTQAVEEATFGGITYIYDPETGDLLKVIKDGQVISVDAASLEYKQVANRLLGTEGLSPQDLLDFAQRKKAEFQDPNSPLYNPNVVNV